MIVDLCSSANTFKWKVCSQNGEYDIDATVPGKRQLMRPGSPGRSPPISNAYTKGDIHGDLITAGLLTSIYYRDTHIK